MANSNTTTLAESLARVYTRQKFLVDFERKNAAFYSMVEDFPDGGDMRGTARYFQLKTKNAHAAGVGAAENAVIPTYSAPASLQPSVSPVVLLATLELSELYMIVGRGEGSLTQMDVIDDHVKMTRENAVSALNRATLGHGTGRMAVVQTTTVTATTAIMRLPEGTAQLRENMIVAFYDTDASGGVVQTLPTVNYRTITAINHRTRTVTFDTACTLTAGWGVYKVLVTHATAPTTEFLTSTNGLRSINDDGTLAASIFGYTRSSNTQLNAKVIDESLGAYSESKLRTAVDLIAEDTGLLPDNIWCNSGMVAEHLNSLTGNRSFQTVGSDPGVPSYNTGSKYKVHFIGPDGTPIPFNVDRDLPWRELNIVTQRYFRRMVGKELNWGGDDIGPEGSASPYFLQKPSTDTYAWSKVAFMSWVGNIAHLQPRANTRDTNYSDARAGD